MPSDTGRHHIQKAPPSPPPPTAPSPRRAKQVIYGLVAIVVVGAVAAQFIAALASSPADATPAPPVTVSPPPAAEEQHLLDHPGALPTTEEKVVSAHALGFLTSLIKGGVDVDHHEMHIVMVAETMCPSFKLPTDEQRTKARGELVTAARVLFPHWRPAQAQRYVADAHHYCHALDGKTHETGHTA